MTGDSFTTMVDDDVPAGTSNLSHELLPQPKIGTIRDSVSAGLDLIFCHFFEYPTSGFSYSFNAKGAVEWFGGEPQIEFMPWPNLRFRSWTAV